MLKQFNTNFICIFFSKTSRARKLSKLLAIPGLYICTEKHIARVEIARSDRLDVGKVRTVCVCCSESVLYSKFTKLSSAVFD